MKKFFIFLVVLLFVSACATKSTKFQKKVENCKETYGYFTKSIECLGFNFNIFIVRKTKNMKNNMMF